MAWITPGLMTHSEESNQRYEPLTFDVDDTGSLAVSGPDNPTQCPPDYSRMFAISSAGVSSAAPWVNVTP
ncbi:MAG: DUF1929 domain-containing protein [Planctomycetes bacterium]|nr:DUF1929 domain-containing protein [Planctomycetota bacterium]